MQELNRQPRIDAEDLDRLALFHRIFGYLAAVGSLCGLPHFFIGFFTSISPTDMKNSEIPPALFGGIFMFAGAMVMALAVTLSILNFKSENAIKTRSNLTLIQVTAALNCLAQPIGLALGIYTFILTSRSTIRDQFRNPPLPQ
jgi:uncharacterized membrane protein